MQDANQYAIHGPGDDERRGVRNNDVECDIPQEGVRLNESELYAH
jgi:hypothetical protein